MYRFYEKVIAPLIVQLGPKKIVEIGAYKGDNTKKLLGYCQENDALLISIDPSPLFDYKDLELEYPNHFSMRCELSLNTLANLDAIDLVLIDGDHNWYTVYNELQLIYKNNKNEFPVVIFHDVAWPYARRDLYYNPENIPPFYRQPYEKKCIKKGNSELVEVGINGHLNNSIYETNYRNGVLTAIEDFISDVDGDFEFVKLNGLNGLGICYDGNSRIEKFIDREMLLEAVLDLTEDHRVAQQIDYNELKKLLKKHVEEIEKLEKISIRQSELIGRLEAKTNQQIGHMERSSNEITEIRNENESLRSSLDSLQLEREEHKKDYNKLVQDNETLTSSNASMLELLEKSEETKNQLSVLERIISEKDVELSRRGEMLPQYESELYELKRQVEWQERELGFLNESLAEKDNRLIKKDEYISKLGSRVVTLEEVVSDIKGELEEKDQVIALMERRFAEECKKNLLLKNDHIALQKKNEQEKKCIGELQGELTSVYTGVSWRMTRPIRRIFKGAWK